MNYVLFIVCDRLPSVMWCLHSLFDFVSLRSMQTIIIHGLDPTNKKRINNLIHSNYDNTHMQHNRLKRKEVIVLIMSMWCTKLRKCSSFNYIRACMSWSRRNIPKRRSNLWVASLPDKLLLDSAERLGVPASSSLCGASDLWEALTGGGNRLWLSKPKDANWSGTSLLQPSTWAPSPSVGSADQQSGD